MFQNRFNPRLAVQHILDLMGKEKKLVRKVMGGLKGWQSYGLREGKYTKNSLCEIIKEFKILFKFKMTVYKQLKSFRTVELWCSIMK